MERHELRCLLANLRKSIALWLLMNREVGVLEHPMSHRANVSFNQIQTDVAAILKHGQSPAAERDVFEGKDFPFTALQSTPNARNSLLKLVDDFEWVRKFVQIQDSMQCGDKTAAKRHSLSTDTITTTTSSIATVSSEQFLSAWTLRNLKANNLCSCLQALVADKELLETYYRPGSFLRNETYSTALFICLSSLELRQYSLLSQVKPELYRVTHTIVQPRRSKSHPNISISLSRKSFSKEVTSVECTQHTLQTDISTSISHHQPTMMFSPFRRVKSLPALNYSSFSSAMPQTNTRPRSKTMATNTMKTTGPKSLLKEKFQPMLKSDLSLAMSSSSSSCSGEVDTQPSTSVTSRHSESTLSSFVSNNSNTKPTASSTVRPIEIINCDDIKIWTDRDWEQQQQNQHPYSPKQTTASCGIPESDKTPKSISPISSFLSSLFSTPPPPSRTCVSWSYHHARNADTRDSSGHCVFPCNSCHELDTSGSSVFASFLPTYGKKLRRRKSQNLFEDGISSVDQKFYQCSSAVVTSTKVKTAEIDKPSTQRIVKDAQSLTGFLQMAQLSRNNTELEKENAHFRISEAIISAIEHIKWAKIEPDKLRRQNETTTAMDWLENEQLQKKESQPKDSQFTDHISCAEVGEICSDSLSAEVVGLCLISKFNDQHLPKVSELKWLVAEEDTPQQLLPMPENSSSRNPDDNILPPVIRGTKYWAPPRQQIIFTDHPAPNRKELIRKQNNRCAGCGMRVSLQYLSSFRYCTYLGKYHCTGCHRNQMSAIPAKILNMWDFKCYPVSVFAYRLLDQMYAYPLFHVADLNAELYTRSKFLLAARTKRVQLKFVRDFIKTCRFATIEQDYFTSIPDYICADPDIWSMSDFMDTNNRSLERYIAELILKCEAHIFNCVLCVARGFICEHCREDKVIFPWQKTVYRCDCCGACFHLNCWKSISENCCRCQRIRTRHDEGSEHFC